MPEPIDLKTKPPKGESAPKVKPRDAGAGPRDAAEAAGPDPKRRTPTDRKLAASLAQFYAMIGVGIAGVGQASHNIELAAAGVNVASRAEESADAWMDLADTSPRVRKMLEGFATGGSWAGVVASTVTIVAPIAVAIRRDNIPEQMSGMILSTCLSDEAKAAHAMFTTMANANGNG